MLLTGAQRVHLNDDDDDDEGYAQTHSYSYTFALTIRSSFARAIRMPFRLGHTSARFLSVHLPARPRCDWRRSGSLQMRLECSATRIWRGKNIGEDDDGLRLCCWAALPPGDKLNARSEALTTSSGLSHLVAAPADNNSSKSLALAILLSC